MYGKKFFGTPRAPVPLQSHATRIGPVIEWNAAVVVPAKDEERRITACLDAIAHSAGHAAPCTVGIIVVVNNTDDATATRALAWARAHTELPVIIIDCVFAASDAGVGAARRMALDLACQHLQPDGILMTTDADTRVHPNWVTQNIVELCGADLICGTVLGDPEEARSLPPEISAHGSAEWDYLAASISLMARLDPQPHDPEPAHHNPAGASMAFSRRTYEAVGRLPVKAIGEDRAFADAVLAQDFRVRFSAMAIVETSCRMTGRTCGGMAGALRARAHEPDPWADEWIEPADILFLRYGLQAKLRPCWPDSDVMHRCLAIELGRSEADMLVPPILPKYFGAFFRSIEAQSPKLTRQRMRLSDCRSELPRLRRLLSDTQINMLSVAVADNLFMLPRLVRSK